RPIAPPPAPSAAEATAKVLPPLPAPSSSVELAPPAEWLVPASARQTKAQPTAGPQPKPHDAQMTAANQPPEEAAEPALQDLTFRADYAGLLRPSVRQAGAPAVMTEPRPAAVGDRAWASNETLLVAHSAEPPPPAPAHQPPFAPDATAKR